MVFGGIAFGVSLPSACAGKTPVDNPAAKKADVVAMVNGAEIGREQLNGELYRAEKLAIDAGRFLTAAQVTTLTSELLENLVKQELLYQEAVKKKVTVGDDEIQATLQKLKPQFKTEAAYTKALPTLEAQVQRSAVMKKYVEEAFSAKAQVSDAQVRASYDEHLNNFRKPEQIEMGYILIKAEGDDAGKEKARKKTEALRKRILKGEDFGKIAKKESDDPTAPEGGKVSAVRKGQLLPPLEKALFALKPGEVSPVIETAAGFNLVTAYERTPETAVPFEEVKDELKKLLQSAEGQKAANAHIEEVRKKADVKTYLVAVQ